MSRGDVVRVAVVALSIAIGGLAPADERPGVAPDSPWTCPASHSIKGYLSAESGRRIYFLPGGGPFYDEASPERCYASEDEARRDGSRPARESSPWPGPSVRIRSRPGVQPSMNIAMIF